MNAKPNLMSWADVEIEELDLSRSGLTMPEIIQVDDVAADATAVIESDALPIEAEAEAEPGFDIYADDLLERVGVNGFVFKPAEVEYYAKRANAVLNAEFDHFLAEGEEKNKPSAETKPSILSVNHTDFPATDAAIETFSVAPCPAKKPLITGLPDGFTLREDGVYAVMPPEIKGEEPQEQFLCSPIRVIDQLRERDGSGWGKRIVVTNQEGQETIVSVLNQDLETQGKKILSHLTGLGLSFGRVKRARDIVLDLLLSWKPAKLMLSTSRRGWADEACEAFVLGSGRIIGDPDVVSLNGGTSSGVEAIQARGTLEEWKDQVARLCVSNPLMTTAVSLGFVGPLLGILGLDGGGFHLRGASSRGKTTLQKVAASVWGTPLLVQSWRTTANALEATAARANSMLLLLDELGEVNGKDLNYAAYMLANGAGKERAAGWGKSSPTLRWKLALLSSGEIGIHEKIAEGGHRAKAGQEVRLIDIVADVYQHGAFSELHGCADGGRFAKMVSDRASANCGTAGPKFVEWILEHRETLKADVEKVAGLFRSFVEERYSPPADGVTARTMNWFALVAAAGHLATQAGITGWPTAGAIGAVMVTFGEWLDSRAADEVVATTSAVDRVRVFLSLNGAEFIPVSSSGPTGASTVGWQDEHMFYILSATWKAIHNGIDTKIAARELDLAGYLISGEGENRMRKTPTSILGRPRAYAVKKSILIDPSTVLLAAE